MGVWLTPRVRPHTHQRHPRRDSAPREGSVKDRRPQGGSAVQGSGACGAGGTLQMVYTQLQHPFCVGLDGVGCSQLLRHRDPTTLPDT